MKDRDSEGDALKGLEQEIDQAIDSLFVEKGGGKKKPPAPSMRGASAGSPEKSDVDLDSLAEELGGEGLPLEQEKLGSERATPPEIPEGADQVIEQAAGRKSPEEGGPEDDSKLEDIDIDSHDAPGVAAGEPSQDAGMGVEDSALQPAQTALDGVERSLNNLENLESHLLSLEWEINADYIHNIISELDGLKKAYEDDRAVFQVINVMDKVARSLLNDETNITPDSLRFLLEAKDGIRLLGEELRERESYKNVVLSGILARYQLMQGKAIETSKTGPIPDEERAVGSLARDLRNVSEKLHEEVRHLGSIMRNLRPQPRPVSPSRMVGAVLVQSSSRVFAIPKDIVIGSVQIPHRMVRTVWRDKEIRIRGARLPLINLFRLLHLKGKVRAEDKAVVLIRKNNRTFAILVDRLLQQQAIPANRIREEQRLAYVRGIVPVGQGRNIYFLDTDRMAVEF